MDLEIVSKLLLEAEEIREKLIEAAKIFRKTSFSLEKMSLEKDSILDIIIDYRDSADYIIEDETKEVVIGETLPCSDNDVRDFLAAIEEKKDQAILVVSNISWIKKGSEKNELFPVILKATKLPDNRYYLELTGIDFEENYIYDPKK